MGSAVELEGAQLRAERASVDRRAEAAAIGEHPAG